MCWGGNFNGQLGDGTTANRAIATVVVGLDTPIESVVAGDSHTCALSHDGAVWCWGNNMLGQLGNGSTSNSTSPVVVESLGSGIAAIDAGQSHTCAVLEDGGLKCWGGNVVGVVGDGTTVDRLTPTDVLGLSSGVAAVSTGTFHTCALTAQGGIMCWGVGFWGKLGAEGADTCDSGPPFGLVTCATSPLEVTERASGVATVSAGRAHTCSTLDDGRAECWGLNNLGKVGDGSTSFSSVRVPVEVIGLPGPLSMISAGYSHTCGLLLNGDVMCWGGNLDGQLGDDTTADSLMPVAVLELKAESGDANCDGSVNAIDAALILQYNAGLLGSLPCATGADVNGDGNITSIDAALILQFSAGLLGSLGPPLTQTSVDVSLTEFVLEPSVDSVPAGTVTFNVSSTGAIFHNFRVVATDLDPEGLPVDDATFAIDESQVNVVGSTADLNPGDTEELTVDLEAGRYVLICNIPTHYDIGMTVAFTVK